MSEESNDISRLKNADPLRQEASEWFVRMRGADAEAHRDEFEAWLRRGALHRAAYNSVAATFAVGKNLSRSDLLDDPVQHHPHPPIRRIALFGGVVAILLVAISVGWLFHAYLADRSKGTISPAKHELPSDPAIFLATGAGDVRAFRLSDGSRLTLDADSEVRGDLLRTGRTLRLVRGRARFEVAHDGRLFVVLAGSGRVTARGTVFDVELQDKQGFTVNLLHGAVDVDGAVDRSVMLSPGQSITIGHASAVPVRFAPAAVAWTSGRMSFDNATVAEVVRQANARSSAQISVASPDIAELRVSGSFKIADGAVVAQRIAHLYNLVVEEGPSGNIILRKER